MYKSVICIQIYLETYEKNIQNFNLVYDDMVPTRSKVPSSGGNCPLEYCTMPRVPKLRTPVLKCNQWCTGFLLSLSVSNLCNLGARRTDANVLMLMLLARS